LAVSFAAIFTRRCQAGPVAIAAGRMTVAVLVLLPWCFRYRKELTNLTRRTKLVVVLAGLALSIHFVAWNAAVLGTSLANALLIGNVHPLFVLAVERWLFGLGTPRLRVVGTLLAVCGASVVSFGGSSSGTHSLEGDLAAVVAAAAFAAYLLIGQRVRRHLSLVPYVTIVYGAAAIALNLAACWTQPLLGLSAETYSYLVLLGLVPTLIGHSAWNLAVRHISPTIVAISALGEPIGAGALGYWMLDEPVEGRVVAAGAVMLLGLALTLLPARKTSRDKGATAPREARESSAK
jgi:drug/metabolite transporter (DMT)-like permease